MNRKEEMERIANELERRKEYVICAGLFETAGIMMDAAAALRAPTAPKGSTSEFSTAEIIEHADYVHELANSAVSGIGQATGLRIERMLREFAALPSDSGKAAPVAFRWRLHGNKDWWMGESDPRPKLPGDNWEVEPLYAALAPATEGSK